MTVQDQILDLLREKSGAIVDAYNVAEHIGKAINIPAGRVRDALGALQARGLVTHENIRTAALTEAGWGANGTAEPVAVGAPPAEVARTRSIPAPSSPAAPVQQPKKEKAVMGKPTVAERIVLELERTPGKRIQSADGGCVDDLTEAIGAPRQSIVSALYALEGKALITKVSERGKGTMSIALASGKGATNGDVSELRGGNRVGDDRQRKAPAVRRKAKQGRRPKRGAAGGKRPAGRRTVRKGRRRVDAPSHDVQAGRAVAVEDTLDAYLAVCDALRPLTQDARPRVLRAVESTLETA